MDEVEAQRAASDQQNRTLQDDIKNIWKLTGALPLLSITVLLTGCGTQHTLPQPLVQYRTISQPRLNLPASLTSQIDVPVPSQDMTFGDSVSLNAELYGALRQCNIDRKAIRKIEANYNQRLTPRPLYVKLFI